MTSEYYKQKNDIPDLYHMLGLTSDICQEPNCNELIHKAYIKKAKLCHPDLHPDREDIKEVFVLITSAYDILRDEKQRMAYNHKLSLDKQSSSDFFKLKKSTTDHMETIGQYKPATDDQKLGFKDKMKVLDVKHGYDASIEKVPIPKHEAKKKMEQAIKERAVQDIELQPARIFQEGQQIDLQKFNEAFDRTHKRADGAMMPHNGIPSAWNDLGSVANYSNFDNLDNLYVEDGNRFDTGRDAYSGIDFGAPTKPPTKEEVASMKGADYVTGHKVIGDDYYRDMKQKLRERKSEAEIFENMKYNDFKLDDTAGYGIFDQLGIKYEDRLSLDIDDEDLSKKLDKLIAERQKDVPASITPNNAPKPPKKSNRR